jgi:hypothetical protein
MGNSRNFYGSDALHYLYLAVGFEAYREGNTGVLAVESDFM